jgi:hypothetical protein
VNVLCAHQIHFRRYQLLHYLHTLLCMLPRSRVNNHHVISVFKWLPHYQAAQNFNLTTMSSVNLGSMECTSQDVWWQQWLLKWYQVYSALSWQPTHMLNNKKPIFDPLLLCYPLLLSQDQANRLVVTSITPVVWRYFEKSTVGFSIQLHLQEALAFLAGTSVVTPCHLQG